MALRLTLLASICSVLAACGDDSAPPPDAARDAGAEASIDARIDAADGPDAALACEPTCAVGSLCCTGEDEVPGCVDTRTSNEHCGRCNYECTPERGDACEQSFCACGLVREGCLGTQRDTCCASPSGTRTCRNLDIDPGHCGACGRACDPLRASGCRNGVCECGDLRGECEGTPESVCCPAAVAGGAQCVNVLTSESNCGACNFACAFGFRCIDGICSLDGEACTPACEFPDSCCRGECCDVTFCRDDGCM